jgi:hypothetical protein
MYDADLGNSIYDYQDNHIFVEQLPVPGDSTGREHAIFDFPEETFYKDTRDPQTVINGEIMPYRSTSYILLSAGFDGEYGTDDDVYNFSK